MQLESALWNRTQVNTGENKTGRWRDSNIMVSQFSLCVWTSLVHVQK